MEKFIQLGEKFGLEGEKLLEFVREKEEKEEQRRQLEEEKAVSYTHLTLPTKLEV